LKQYNIFGEIDEVEYNEETDKFEIIIKKITIKSENKTSETKLIIENIINELRK
jgi:hypothetical protein